MYLQFYGLQEKPFNATPDPRFLYLTPGHREALAQLTYGVQESQGFMILTGEVGTGKTTLLRALSERLHGGTAIAFVFNSTLPFDDLLEYAMEDFGIAKAHESRAQRLVALNTFLTERRQAGQQAVLIVDEAQNLDPSTLEEVRLLSNFETATEKLLQIVLVGQPELLEKLQLPSLRQLRQRIGLRCVIPPLTVEETREYIRSRLRIAGCRERNLFSDGAAAAIASYSQGIPRVVNMVCDHSLLIGYAEQRRRIDKDIVQEAIAYLESGIRTRRRRKSRRRWAPTRRLALGAVGVAILVLTILTALATVDTAALASTLGRWLPR